MREKVVVIGGGYAGALAANRLASTTRVGLDVVLINPRDRFVERIRLHEYIAGTRDDAGIDFGQILNPAIQLVVDHAVRIDTDNRHVELRGGATVEFDYVVYAAGSRAPALPRGALSVSDIESSTRLREHVAGLSPGARIAVVGGGLSGVETAAELGGHSDHAVTLYSSDAISPGLSQGSRARLVQGLRRVGVIVQEHVAVPEHGDIGEQLGADLVIWCAGFGVSSLALDSGLPVDRRGRMVVDGSLRARGTGRVFGAGDGAVIDAPGYAHLRMSCASAMPMGGQAADNIIRLVAGLEPKMHSNGFVAQCISIGRRDAVIQLVDREDTPRSLRLTRRLGARVKEEVSRQTVRWLRQESVRAGAYSWLKGPQPPAGIQHEVLPT